MGHRNTSCDHIYIKPSSNQRSTTSREASAAGRLRPNAQTGKSNPPAFQSFAILKAEPNSTLLAIATARTASDFSFPFYLLRTAFFAAHLSGWPHELVAAFALLSDWHLARWSDDFFDFRQIWK